MKTLTIAILSVLVLNSTSAFAKDVECLTEEKPVKATLGKEKVCLSPTEGAVLAHMRWLGYEYSSAAELNASKAYTVGVKQKLAEKPMLKNYDYQMGLSPSDLAVLHMTERADRKELSDAFSEDRAIADKRRGGVKIGMTAKAVEASSWGRPGNINRTTTANGVTEQWCYGSGSYIYFARGRVTAIQN